MDKSYNNHTKPSARSRPSLRLHESNHDIGTNSWLDPDDPQTPLLPTHPPDPPPTQRRHQYNEPHSPTAATAAAIFSSVARAFKAKPSRDEKGNMKPKGPLSPIGASMLQKMQSMPAIQRQSNKHGSQCLIGQGPHSTRAARHPDPWTTFGTGTSTHGSAARAKDLQKNHRGHKGQCLDDEFDFRSAQDVPPPRSRGCTSNANPFKTPPGTPPMTNQRLELGNTRVRRNRTMDTGP